MTTPIDSRQNSPTGLGWLLWILLATLPWLLPTHTEPWPMFYSEALAFAAFLAAAAWACWVAPRGWHVSGPALALAVLVAAPLLQAALGLFVFPGESLLIALYLLALALTMMLAQQAQTLARGRLIDAVLASLLIAGLLSAGMALYQWLRLDHLGMLVAPPLTGGRPVANLGQPNNLATLLVWSLVAIWWGRSRGCIGVVAAAVGSAFLLLGVALTQSRTGWLAVGLFFVAMPWALGTTAARRLWPVWAALAAWFVVAVVALDPLSRALFDHGAPLSLGQQVAAGKRPQIWAMFLDAVAQQPWAGYGWNQSVRGHVALAADYPELGVAVQHAHNLVLDLVLWNGLPLGLLLAGALAWWAWRQVRDARSAQQRLLLLALGLLVLHALLELPHLYAFFLLPAAAFAGTLQAGRPVQSPRAVPRAWVAVGLGSMAALLVTTVHDYQQIETGLTSQRLRAAHIGLVDAPVPRPHLLTGLQAAIEQIYAEPQRGMDPEALKHWQAATTRYPSPVSLFRFAQAAAINGRPDEARWAIATLCHLHAERSCAAARQDWQTVAAKGFPEMEAIRWPDAVSTPTGR